jgi:hypothetical protein
MGHGDDLLILEHPDPKHAVAAGEDRLPVLVSRIRTSNAAVAASGSTRSTARMPST